MRISDTSYAAYTEQNDLVKALHNTDDAEHITRLKEGLRFVARKLLDDVFDRQQVNIIAAPADSSLCIHAAASGKWPIIKSPEGKAFVVGVESAALTNEGYPIATVPLGQLDYNGRPFGICLMARENDEERLLGFMSAYERLMSTSRAVPSLKMG